MDKSGAVGKCRQKAGGGCKEAWGGGDLGIPEQEGPSPFYNRGAPFFIPVCPGAGGLWPPPLWATAAGRGESH